MAVKAHICKALNRKIFLPIPQLMPGRANRAPKPLEMSASNPRPRLFKLGFQFSSKPSPSFPWGSWDPGSEVKGPQLSPQRYVHPPPPQRRGWARPLEFPSVLLTLIVWDQIFPERTSSQWAAHVNRRKSVVSRSPRDIVESFFYTQIPKRGHKMSSYLENQVS